MSMLNVSMPKYSLKTRTYFWNSNGGKTQFRANFVIWSLQLEGVVLINPSTKHTVTSRTVALVALFLDLNKAWFRKYTAEINAKLTCVTFPFIIAPRKKPLAYSFLPSFDNANDRLCRETLGTSRSDNGDANENVAKLKNRLRAL